MMDFKPGDWKRIHANKADEFARHQIIERVLDEFADNMGFARKGWPEYGLSKIVHAVAMVVLARSLNIDPEALRLSSDEIDEVQRRIIEMAYQAGVPVIVVESDG